MRNLNIHSQNPLNNAQKRATGNAIGKLPPTPPAIAVKPHVTLPSTRKNRGNHIAGIGLVLLGGLIAVLGLLDYNQNIMQTSKENVLVSDHVSQNMVRHLVTHVDGEIGPSYIIRGPMYIQGDITTITTTKGKEIKLNENVEFWASAPEYKEAE